MSKSRLLGCAAVVLAAALAHAVPCVTLEVAGDTFVHPPGSRIAFNLHNRSGAGERIVRFRLDVSTAMPDPAVFDTQEGLPPNETVGHDFTALAGSAATTGLVPLTGTPKVADGASLLDLSFTHFAPGERLYWNIDVDAADGDPGKATILGSQLAGSLVYIDFNTGLELSGTLEEGDLMGTSRVTLPLDVPPPVIPEPTTLTLCLIGLAALRLRRRRRSAS